MKNKKMIVILLVIFTLITLGNVKATEEIKEVVRIPDRFFVSLGDSITARDGKPYPEKEGKDEFYIGYQQHIKQELKMDRYINLGSSGATIARGSDYLRGLSKIAGEFTFEGAEFIIIQAGTNDFSREVPLGDISEFKKVEPDRYNFYGGYAGLVSDLKARNEGIPIYLFTPTRRDCTNFQKGCKNKNGNTLDEFSQAIKDVAKYYDVHVVDMYGLPHIKQGNLDKYMVDGGLHPNNRGYRLMANKFISDFERINKK